MDDYESLSPKWECNYHVVFIPKCRKKVLYGDWGSPSGRCSQGWGCRRKAGSNKVTSCRTTSATPTAASSGPISKAPGSAGGYLHPKLALPALTMCWWCRPVVPVCWPV
jgi:hypothetical protein